MAKKKHTQHSITLKLSKPGRKWDHGLGFSAEHHLKSFLSSRSLSGEVTYDKNTQELSIQAPLTPDSVTDFLVNKGYLIKDQQITQEQVQDILPSSSAQLEVVITRLHEQLAHMAHETARKESSFARREKKYISQITMLEETVETHNLKSVNQGVSFSLTDDFATANLSLFHELEAMQKILRFSDAYTSFKAIYLEQATPFELSDSGSEEFKKLQSYIDRMSAFSGGKQLQVQFEALQEDLAITKNNYELAMSAAKKDRLNKASRVFSDQTIHLLYLEDYGAAQLVLPVFTDNDLRSELACDIFDYVQNTLLQAQLTLSRKKNKDLSFEQSDTNGLVSFSLQPKGGVPLAYLLAQLMNNTKDENYPLVQAGFHFSVSGLARIKQSPLEQTLNKEQIVSSQPLTYDVTRVPGLARKTSSLYQVIIDVVAANEDNPLKTDELSTLVHEHLKDDSVDLGRVYGVMKRVGLLEPRPGTRQGYIIGQRLKDVYLLDNPSHSDS